MENTWKIGLPTDTYEQATACSDLGISNLRRSLLSCGQDQVTFRVVSALALTANASFTYKTRYTIWKDEETRWFTGIVTSIPRQGDTQAEFMEICLSGPWWYFDNCLFQQVWKVWDQTEEEVIEEARCRVILFQSLAGSRITSGDQVEEVVDWLIARGAPIAKGTIDSGIELPYDEQVNMSCAAVLQTVLRWMPDWVGWFDYSVEPPEFNFRARASLAPVTQALSSNLSSLGITPRYDLQKPGVQIVYEQTNDVDGVSYCTRTLDTAGTTSAIDAIHAVFDLAGSQVSYLKQKITVESRPLTTWNQAALIAWLRSHVHWLNHNRVPAGDMFVSFETIPPTADNVLLNRLVSGQIQDWMTEAPLSLTAQPTILRFTFTRVVRNAAGRAVDVENNVVGDVNVILTDAVEKTYQIVASWDSGEPVPSGVAAAIYAAWGILHFEGSFLLIEEECSGSILPGLTINLSGGRAEWGTMNAVVQSVDEDVDSGQTTVRFGPPAALEADSLVALLRALRGRRYAYRREDRKTGESNGSTSVELSGYTVTDTPADGAGEKEKLVIIKQKDE